MYKMTLGEIAGAIKARMVKGNADRVYTQVCTDSRQIVPGSLFVALKGERFDAHEFLEQALQLGAHGVIVSRMQQDLPDGDILLVDNTLTALQQLARYNRKKFSGPVVAVTGSNGKTTTKDMISALLETKYRVLKTLGNFNNEIGLPLTLLGLDESHGAVVVEMGMRGLGEIDFLARIACPTAGVITNIGETHLERLGTVENIARAKTELLPHIPVGGYAVLNGDDPWQRKYAHLTRAKVIFYGMDHSNHVYADNIKCNMGAGASFTVIRDKIAKVFHLPVPGRHNIYNALAAITVGLQEGLSWEMCMEGLHNVVLSGMRLQIIDCNGLKIINDTYNANPASSKAAVRILAEMPCAGKKVAVLGDMYELGQRTVQGHREVGETVQNLKIDILVTVGELALHIAEAAKAAGMDRKNIYVSRNNNEALEILNNILKAGDLVLVKGSRGMKMEKIVEGITCA
ncbi:UDP-N-acetylmuramoylalanyl-D-glutamyl-2, 6-diaminopimelate/D-alanyl-D-alanyl ligase [Thermincola ferriacetica]|uniref:UDP-N-acetylmuramoyl-tripeptide--D-alanyl-D-alanine ligase n=1 Tax=Thermincola ferriacetica TaxID=281456 RepID=A0A0L6W4M4_9FIRM|nr:UDP-N-acetylmuramoyl-tripeptide--D-alanyl-D-alanine ligase [Thermincola ferriacetica]KNZ70475.1 UDP-N-acetylmuramoylalanyl-D-glutamyl-2, 6-diaminopimelate/D-alanyl-D-alanyl ligase [Thermincola ferriacetica]